MQIRDGRVESSVRKRIERNRLDARDLADVEGSDGLISRPSLRWRTNLVAADVDLGRMAILFLPQKQSLPCIEEEECVAQADSRRARRCEGEEGLRGRGRGEPCDNGGQRERERKESAGRKQQK